MLPNYAYICPLGTGRYSTTKRFKDIVSGEDVAIKFISLEDGKVPDVIKNEVSIHSTLSHPNIVEFKTSFQTEDHLCIVMEYVDGGDLHGVISKHTVIPEETVKSYMMQMMDILEYLHKSKICHKDIKLENLLVTENGNTIKLCDFGFAAKYDNFREIQKKYGTPSYMAPEIIQNRIEDFDAIDIWSSGVLMYVMLFGRFPFEDRIHPHNVAKLLRNITRGDYMFPSSITVSKDAENFIQSVLETDPRYRPTVEQLRWHSWVRGEKVYGFYDGLENISCKHGNPYATVHVQLV
jgi:serine/threonine-protein kinase SRK2